jgi:hypothetical protein
MTRLVLNNRVISSLQFLNVQEQVLPIIETFIFKHSLILVLIQLELVLLDFLKAKILTNLFSMDSVFVLIQRIQYSAVLLLLLIKK